MPTEWHLKPRSFSERNDLFLENAVKAPAEAAGKALDQVRLEARDIDAIVVVYTTGVATPALDARLMQVMPFRPDVRTAAGIRPGLRRRGRGTRRSGCRSFGQVWIAVVWSAANALLVACHIRVEHHALQDRRSQC